MALVLETLVEILDEYPNNNTLKTKARLMRDMYFENSSLFENDENNDLENRIRDVAYEAEDILVGEGKFKEVIEKIDSILEEIYVLAKLANSATSLSTSSSSHLGSIDVVGFDEVVTHLIMQLTSRKRQMLIIPIVGATGTGKTTLIGQIYCHPAILEHFDDFALVTIPQPFEHRSALIAVMSSMKRIPSNMDEMTDEKLGVCVYQNLVGGRYLIILDGVSHYTALDKLKNFFPDERKRSRVMVTTRDWSIANYIETEVAPYEMQPIDEDASFELLRRTVMGQYDDIPHELEYIGRKIARNCKGHPLAVTIISNVLSMTEMTHDLWNRIEICQSRVINREGLVYTEDHLLNEFALSPSTEARSTSNNNILGFDGAISQLMNQINSSAPELQVIHIVGRGGGGKTTLARQLYDHSSIANSFQSRAWITISETFDLRGALVSLLKCLLINFKVHLESSDKKLGEEVSANLKDKKYFIVVDDIWHASAWEELRAFFPDNRNGSRIISTTRMQDVADYDKSSSSSHEMKPLDENESWKLIVQKVFGGHDELCLPVLKNIGRNIVRKCDGCPLSLVMAAGVLSTSKKTEDVWKNVEACTFNSKGVKEIKNDSNLKAIASKFRKYGTHLVDLINGRERELRIIPIIGSGGGNGKETLARLIYRRLLLAKEFDTHAWATSSPHKEIKDFLPGLLGSLSVGHNEKLRVTDDNTVEECVHKALHDKRYLIVLEDIKDKNTWDMLRMHFKDYKNGSRIILTAREWTSDDNENIKPLTLDQHWEYLLRSAFEQEHSSIESGETQSHATLPNSGTSPMNVFWDLVRQDTSNGDSELQPELLAMSYNHLPCHLKPCFLYMGSLPEDYEIKASKLINLWIAEGFVKQDNAKTCLKDLISRNLLTVSRRKRNGSVAAIKIHDIFWKFCTEKANEKNFLLFKGLDSQNTTKHEHVRRLSVPSLSQETDLTGSNSSRSFLCLGRVSENLNPMFLDLKFLRVLDILEFEFDTFPDDMLELVNLRYLGITCLGKISSEIKTFESLLFLAIAKALSLPKEIWEMAKLKHIKCKETREWVHDDSFDANCPKKNLQTLSDVPASLISKFFVGCYPNITKLGIFFDPNVQTSTDIHLDGLNKLESLKCSSYDMSIIMSIDFFNLTFPVSLKKMTLRSCEISTLSMRAIGALPNLEQLILQSNNFLNQTWESAEGEFSSLCFLRMEDLNLVIWEFNRDQFSELQHVVIRRCPSMRSIPQRMKYIRALETIEVDASSENAVKLVLQMKEEREKMGMDSFEVVIHNT